MEGRSMVTGGEWKIIAISGGLASLTRLSNLSRKLRRKDSLTLKKFLLLFLLALLQGGTAGIVVAMLLWSRLHDAPIMLLGVSMLAGFGGIELLELLYTFGIAVMKQFAADAIKGSSGKDTEDK
jgi:asparagine N-glycosylation enzyme membrane subunit Stt3